MSSTITIEVVDTDCETAKRQAFPPKIKLTTVGTTLVQTRRGWTPFLPGDSNLYKRATYSGSITQKAYPALDNSDEVNAQQCGGAKFVYDSYDQINALGAVLNRHTKMLSTMCYNTTPLMYDVITGGGNVDVLSVHSSPGILLGYCWLDDPTSCSDCPTDVDDWGNLVDYAFIGPNDFPNGLVWSAGLFTVPNSTERIYNGTVNIGGFVTALCLKPGTPGFPTNTGFGHYTTALPFIRIESTGDFTITLSDPFTDEDLAQTTEAFTNKLATAENKPNYVNMLIGTVTTIKSRITSVAYTLSCSNLIIGNSYTARAKLVCTNGTKQTLSFPFVAANSTHNITGTIPTPPAGHSTTISSPSIS